MPRKSILRDYQAMRRAIEEPSIRAALESLGLRAAGGNYVAFKQACEQHGLVVPVCTPHAQTLRARSTRVVPLEDALIMDSTYSRHSLKRRLLREGLIDPRCEICGMDPFWNGKFLALQLDHRNGVWNDNRLANLRLLCPNCHSQTATFCGPKVVKTCGTCGVRIGIRSSHCRLHSHDSRDGSSCKIDWPIITELVAMLQTTPMTAVAATLGVSDSAVRKHLRSRGYVGSWLSPEGRLP